MVGPFFMRRLHCVCADLSYTVTMTNATTTSAADILARNVKRLRIKRGWSQTKLAHKMDRPQPRISEIERAAYPVNMGVIDSLAEVLGVSQSSLLRNNSQNK